MAEELTPPVMQSQIVYCNRFFTPVGPDPAVAQFVTQPTSTTQAVCLGLGL